MLSRTRKRLKSEDFHYISHLDQNSQKLYPVFEPSCQKVQEWLDSPAKIKLLVGANQSGKTTTGAALTAKIAREKPGSLSWAAALDFSMGEILYKKLKEYLAPDEIQSINWASRGKEIPHSIILKNGSHIVFKSMDAGFRKFEGAKIDGIIWLDEECIDKKIYTSCVARTTFTDAPVILTFTPLQGKTWVYRDLFTNVSDNIFSTTISLYDNKFLDPRKRDALIELYSEEEKEYRVFGKWGVLEGRIYKAFSESKHVIPISQERIDRFTAFLRGIDFGRTLACVWIGLDHDEKAYIFAELKVQEIALEDFANEIFKIEEELKIKDRINDTITDHQFQERLELANFGIYCTPAEKKVNYGIEIVRRRLKVHNGGETNLFVSNKCKKTIEEFNDYQYEKARPGQEPSGKPRKVNDHLMDTVRYTVVDLESYCSVGFEKPIEIEGDDPLDNPV